MANRQFRLKLVQNVNFDFWEMKDYVQKLKVEFSHHVKQFTSVKLHELNIQI